MGSEVVKHKPRKRFGQNFLRDQQVLARIVSAINPRASDSFVEIGPGDGALTLVVLPLVEHMDVIELDRDLIPVLKSKCYGYLCKLCIHQADVLKFNFASVARENGKMRIIGNLPYNISTPLLFHIIRFADIIQDAHFMLQREVALRLCAAPGSKTYGRLSVAMQYFFQIDMLFDVARTAFDPVPQVDSGFVRLQPRCYHSIEVDNMGVFYEVIRIAFNQRRKTLRNCLSGVILADQLSSLGIDPQMRPEQLGVDDFVRISNFVRACLESR